VGGRKNAQKRSGSSGTGPPKKKKRLLEWNYLGKERIFFTITLDSRGEGTREKKKKTVYQV